MFWEVSFNEIECKFKKILINLNLTKYKPKRYVLVKLVMRDSLWILKYISEKIIITLPIIK